MLKKQNRKKVLYIIVSLLITMALSVGFSAFQKDLKVEDLLMHVRLQRDTRVSNKTVQRANGAVSNVDDYNVSKIYGNVSFDNTSSYILYKVSLTNYGNVKMGLLDVESNTSGVNYSLCDSNGNNCTSDFKTEICDNNSCTLGASTDIYVKVTANSAAAKNIDLDLDFEPYNDIEYINLHEEPVDFPFEIMSSDSFEITLTSKPEVVEVTGNATVNYNKNTGVLRVSAVDSDLTITAKYLATSVAETIYEGSYPSNFVRFNNTLYRIVTKENVSDGYGNTELRAKIISDSSIGDYVFSECLFSVTDSSIFRNTLSDYYDNLDENSVDLIEYAEFLAGYPMYFGLLSMNDLSNNSVNWLPQNTFTLTIYGEEVTKNFNYNKYYKIVLDDQKTKNDYYAKKTATVCSEPSSVYANINGVLTNTTVNTSMPTYPVTYLKKDVLIVDGTGTPTNPFILELSSDGLQPNPTRIEGRELTANGSYQNLVTVTNQQGVPYFSTSTPLNSSNYSSSGSTSIPTGRAVDYYNIWYYIPAIGNFKAKAGKVNTHIAGIKYTINYSKGTNVNSIEKTSDECTTYGNFMSCTVTLPSITPNDGYGNGKWSDGTNLYNPGDSYTLSSNGTTLTAQATGNTYTATFYYWNGTQIATTTSQCTVSSGSTCAVTIPNAVSNSTGKYTGTYRGVNTAFSDLTMSSLVLSNDTNYYATYTKAVTDYYYNGTQYAAVNLYRNEYFTAVDTISASLATLQTSIINFNEPTNGPGGSEWYGFSTAQDINIEYDSVEEAANSTSANLYSVYEFSATFAAGTGIASVSTSHKECYVVETSTSCSITPPTVTLQNGYTNPKWTQSGTGTIYSISDPIVINTNGYTYTASGVIANYQNTTTNTSYVTLNEAFNAVANNQTIKVLQNTNETTMATLASGKIGIKLDLNGKTINSTATTALTNNGELDIYNTSSTTGKIYGSRTNVIYNTGTLTFNKTASTNKVTIYDDDNGSVTNVLLNYGGSVTVNTNGTLYGYVSGVTNENNGTITISGGKISSQGYKVVTNNSGRISLLSGRIECVSVADCNDAIINYSTLSDSITISGGTITSDVNMISNESSGGVTVSSGSHYGTIENKSTGTINITNISMTGDIYNNTDGTVNINGATIDTDDCCGNNEITNRGTMNIISGTITGRFNVINLIAGTLTLGTNDSTVSTTSPLIQTDGSNNGYGIKISQTNNPTFNFYDGIIKSGNGSGYAINSVPDNTPSGYQVVKEVNNGIESAYLIPKGYLMAGDENAGNLFRSTIAKSDIEKITFANSLNSHTPNGTDCWDVSLNNDGSVLLWANDSNSNGLYEVTIGAEGKVYASNGNNLFFYLTNLTEFDGMEFFDTSDVTNMSQMFYGDFALIDLDLSYFDTSKVTDMSGMFALDGDLVDIDLSSFDTSKVTDMSGMFLGVTVNTLDVSYLNTSNVTNMSEMFYGWDDNDGSLTNIVGLNNFNTSKVTNMSHMFARNDNLLSLDVSHFDTSNVENMRAMFSSLRSLVTLDLRNFDTSSVTEMSYMFSDNANLKTIYASDSFVTTNVVTSTGMFSSSSHIVGSMGTSYNSSHLDKEYAHIDGGTSNPGYFTLYGSEIPIVAVFVYNKNTNNGYYTPEVATVACYLGQNTSCTVEIPSEVQNSIGKYNSPYHGVSLMNSMQNANLTISQDSGFYANYSTPVTIWYPDSTSTRASYTYYRNEFYGNNGFTQVISTSATGISNVNISSSISGYSLYGFANSAGTNTRNYSSVVALAKSNKTTSYALFNKNVTATFYYNSNTTAGSLTVGTATASGDQYIRCTSSAAEISNSNISTPSEVTGSVGKQNSTFKAVTNATSSMGSVAPTTGYTTYYANYSSSVTNYYYLGGYASRTLYRNEFFTSTSAMGARLATANNTTDNYTTATGPNSSVWSGLSTGQDTTAEYSSVQNAADSSSATLYTVYQYNVTYAKGSNVNNIGATSGNCKITTSSTSCNVTLPSITPASGYISAGWNTDKDASSGTSAGSNYSIDSNNIKLYGNAKKKTTTLSFGSCNASGLLAKCYTGAKSVPSGYTSPLSISITWTNSSISGAGEGNGVVFAQYSKDSGSSWTNFEISGGRCDYSVGCGYYVNYGASSTTRSVTGTLPTGVTHIRLVMSSNAYAYNTAVVSLGSGSAVIQGP